jgi:hypothetical protein
MRAFDAATRATLVFNDTVSVVNDLNSETRAFWSRMPAAASVLG